MAVTCPRCGAEYDAALFTFDRAIRCGCGAWVDLSVGHTWRAQDREGSANMSMSIASQTFEDGARIPQKYTGDGADVSPPLRWDDVPQGTRELALICDDPDAPTPQPWVHWVLYKLAPETAGLPEGVPGQSQIETPIAACQGRNSFSSGRTIGYRGPAPPPGHGTHHYHFKLYALDAELALNPGIDKDALLEALDGHVLAEAELVGTYER
jgi:hypothetical protein